MSSKACSALSVIALSLLTQQAAAQTTTLRVYLGGSNRVDVMRKLFESYEKQNPKVKLVIEAGGSTSDLQRRYLSTVLSARDPSLDVMQIDIVNPAQFMKARWIEPLDALLGADAATLLKGFLPTYVYPFQFPVSTVDRSGPGPSLLSLQPAILLIALSGVVLMVAYAVWVWRVAAAEESADVDP